MRKAEDVPPASFYGTKPNALWIVVEYFYELAERACGGENGIEVQGVDAGSKAVRRVGGEALLSAGKKDHKTHKGSQFPEQLHSGKNTLVTGKTKRRYTQLHARCLQ